MENEKEIGAALAEVREEVYITKRDGDFYVVVDGETERDGFPSYREARRRATWLTAVFAAIRLRPDDFRGISV